MMYQQSKFSKSQQIRSMFDQIVPSYDLLNHVMSLYQDVYWRNWTIQRINRDSKRILDIATGTGDLGFEALKQLPGSHVTGMDFSREMLYQAKRKIVKKNVVDRFSLVNGDALKIPFPDNTFDAAMIAFGIRNVVDKPAGLKEMARVVKPGGKVLTLEMTFPKTIVLRKFFSWYLNNAIPFVGGIISGKRSAYQYLPDTIQSFLTPDQLLSLFKNAGLVNRRAWRMTFGITYLHEGIVPVEQT